MEQFSTRYDQDRWLENNNYPYLSNNEFFSSEEIEGDKIEWLQQQDKDTILFKAIESNDIRVVQNNIVTDNIDYETPANCVGHSGLPITIFVYHHLPKDDYYISGDDLNLDTHSGTVIYLLEKGFMYSEDEESKKEGMENIFDMLVVEDNYNAVKYILERKLFTSDDVTSTLGFYVMSIKMIDLLFEFGFKLNQINASIYSVIGTGNIDVVKYLVEKKGLILTIEHLNDSINNPYSLFYYILSQGIEPNEDTLVISIKLKKSIIEKIVRSKGVKITTDYVINALSRVYIRYLSIAIYMPIFIKELNYIEDRLIAAIIDANYSYALEEAVRSGKFRDFMWIYNEVLRSGRTEMTKYLDKVVLNQV